MRRYVSAAAMLAIAGVVAACAGERSSTSPTPAVAAVYQLKSINGMPLPFSRALGSTTLQITNDVLLLNVDGSYVDSTTYAVPFGKTVQTSTTIERGKYKASAGSITFTNQTSGGSSYGATLEGTTLTQSVNGLTPVYERAR